MIAIHANQFEDFFQALHKQPPYSWQKRLAIEAVEGNWPAAIDLPTGSGKTACIDIAIFALACQAARPLKERTAHRRIVFCVNRRVIVDEAQSRARQIARTLWEAERNPDSPAILRHTAKALRHLAGTAEKDNLPPLDVLELRGGIYKDNRWARSAAQPTVLCTTIDQLGSRLLFRGYGVSTSAAPVQAALLAYDSLILLDEAHISNPFLETLSNIQHFLQAEQWAEQSIGVRPFTLVPMTATPPPSIDSNQVLRMDENDSANESLERRLSASKPARLIKWAAKEQLLVDQAKKFVNPGPLAIGILVNRVDTARKIFEALRKALPTIPAELVIGSMRPVDRDKQSEILQTRIGKARLPVTETSSIVVATQCLEVGADYDFDILLTESASLDALRQRFGRLNRAGRPINAQAVIAIRDKDIKANSALDDSKPLDPIYGNAGARTWNWLWEHSDEPSPPEESPTDNAKAKAKTPTEFRLIDLGIDKFQALLAQAGIENGQPPLELLSPTACRVAPVMMPAYLDAWCQTSPVPALEADISLFLHGEQSREPDVQVCWRADLLQNDSKENQGADWCETVALFPPTSAECMSVPISQVRRWLAGDESKNINVADLSDLLDVAAQPGEAKDVPEKRQGGQSEARGVVWRGPSRSTLLFKPNELRPGDTLVLPVQAATANLGHIPELSQTDPTASPPVSIDVAETGFSQARDRLAVRLHPALFPAVPKKSALETLFQRIADLDEPPRAPELKELLFAAAAELPDVDSDRKKLFEELAKGASGFTRQAYPDQRGLVLIAKDRLQRAMDWFLPAIDDGEDDASQVLRDEVTLKDHTSHVVDAVEHATTHLPTDIDTKLFTLAAERHDWGKVDDRFQALLRGTNRTDSWLMNGVHRILLAKSGRGRTRNQLEESYRFDLPLGFRHEMLSVHLAEKAGFSELHQTEEELILHIIGAHHGHARPFAPVVLDDNPPGINYGHINLTAEERKQAPPHRLDSGIAERFWTLNRRYGWWGLAYLEAILRLADQQASAAEDAGGLQKNSSNDSAKQLTGAAQ